MKYLMPVAACDSHVHVFNSDKFPFQKSRSYTPGAALPEDLAKFQRSQDLTRTVLVQPSVYGTDNSCLLDCLKKWSPFAKAVAVIDPFRVEDRTLADLRDKGVCGLRVNFGAVPGEPVRNPVEVIKTTASRIAGTDLFIQIYYSASNLLKITETLLTIDAPVVFDHFAGISALNTDVEIQDLIGFLGDGNFWVKLSAPYRVSREGCNDHVIDNFTGFMLREHSDRLIWGSDWPHTGGGADRAKRGPADIEPFRTVDTKKILDRLYGWCGSDQLFKKILQDNPEQLFGF